MRRRVRFALVLSLAVLGASGCIVGFASIRGSGDVVSLDEDFENFDSVQAGHGCRISISQGSSYRVTIRIGDNIREFLEVEQSGDTLKIGLESGRSYRRIHFEADIQMPDLRKVRLSGAARGQFDRFAVEHDMSIGLSGGSQVEGTVEAEHLKVSTSGGAQVELRGSTRSLELSGSGGSQMRLGNLESGAIRVGLSGGRRSTVNLNGPLTGSLSGGSSVYYEGNPSDIRVSKSGGARVLGCGREQGSCESSSRRETDGDGPHRLRLSTKRFGSSF